MTRQSLIHVYLNSVEEIHDCLIFKNHNSTKKEDLSYIRRNLNLVLIDPDDRIQPLFKVNLTASE